MKYVTITMRAAFTDDVTEEEIRRIAANAYVQIEEPDGTGEGEQTLDGGQYAPAGYAVNIDSGAAMMSTDVALWERARYQIAEAQIRHEMATAGGSYFAPIDHLTLYRKQETL